MMTDLKKHSLQNTSIQDVKTISLTRQDDICNAENSTVEFSQGERSFSRLRFLVH